MAEHQGNTSGMQGLAGRKRRLKDPKNGSRPSKYKVHRVSSATEFRRLVQELTGELPGDDSEEDDQRRPVRAPVEELASGKARGGARGHERSNKAGGGVAPFAEAYGGRAGGGGGGGGGGPSSLSPSRTESKSGTHSGAERGERARGSAFRSSAEGAENRAGKAEQRARNEAEGRGGGGRSEESSGEEAGGEGRGGGDAEEGALAAATRVGSGDGEEEGRGDGHQSGGEQSPVSRDPASRDPKRSRIQRLAPPPLKPVEGGQAGGAEVAQEPVTSGSRPPPSASSNPRDRHQNFMRSYTNMMNGIREFQPAFPFQLTPFGTSPLVAPSPLSPLLYHQFGIPMGMSPGDNPWHQMMSWGGAASLGLARDSPGWPTAPTVPTPASGTGPTT